MQTPAIKVFSERARESALRVRRHQSALGASDKPGGPGVQMGGTTVSPAIAARVRQILAEKAGKGKKKAGGKAKPKASAKQKAADKAKKLAEHTAKLAAAKEARDKAKAERVTASNAKKQASAQARSAKQQAAAQKKQVAAKQKAGSAKQKMQALKQKAQERAKAQAARTQQQDAKAKERVAAPAKKQSENRAKVAKDMADQDAGLAPSGAAALSDFADGKPLDEKVATQFEAMGLTEKGADGMHRLTTEGRAAANAMNKGDTRGAIDAISRAGDKKKASDAKKVTATKAQSDEERAMFAKLGGGRGPGRGYDKSKSKLTTHKGDKAKGGGDESASTTASHSGHAASESGGGPGGRATLKAPISGDMEAHARFVAQKKAAIAARAKQRAATAAQRAKAKSNIAKIDAIQKELRKRNIPIARLRELQQQLSDIRSGKAIDMPIIEIPDNNTVNHTFAIKAGARHSRTDQQHIQAIHDSAVACGADCAPGGDEADQEMDMEAGKAIKSIMDDPGYYAQHECGDIMQASNALSTLAMLIQSELAEEDEDTAHITMLCDAAHTLVDFISAELDELEQAAKDDAEEDATVGHEPMKAMGDGVADWWIDACDAARDAGMEPLAYVLRGARMFKAIDAREDVNPRAGIAEYGKVEFADAKNHKYPIDTEDHIRAAWNYISKAANAAKYDPAEVDQIKAKIVAAWKKKIDKAGPPSAGKAMDDTWPHLEGGAIKAFDEGDAIKGIAVLYGTKATHDLERDFLNKDTDLWLNHWGWPRPITYHHGIDAGTRDDPVIGHWTKATVTDEGVWLEGQLDRAHRYYKAIKELARRGYLKLSSDSAPQWVIREPQSNGVNYIKRWPLVSASVTITPMEPRMLPVEVKALLADLGVEGIDTDSQEAINPASASADGPQADDERLRALSLELDLLELETTL